MGGCISSDRSSSSKLELSDINSNIYRVVNVDDNGVALWNGQLGITRTELTLYRKGRDPTRWPLKCLRRYGYDADVFSFEAGRRCTTGEGIYAFRCRRAESLFQTMQSFIQLSTMSDDGTGTLLSSAAQDIASPLITANANGTTSINTASNYILPNSRSANQTLRMSPSICSDGPNRSFDALNISGSGDVNYLEPIMTTTNRSLTRFHSISDSGGQMSPGGSAEPHSPGSPNSINNILEVTSLNPLPVSGTTNNGVSNIYQEFPLRAESTNNRENNAKKLSLDIPPQEQAPPINFTTINSTGNIFRISSLVSTKTINANTNTNYNETINAESLTYSQPLSPTQSMSINDTNDAIPTYMNVTPGELPDGLSHSRSNNNSNNNIKSNFIADPNHCYENLEPSEIRPMLLRSQQQRRLSKTDAFSKIESAVSSPTASNDKNSEPSTPTNRKVNYIVLDLDQSHAQNNTVSSNGTNVTSSIVASGTDVSSSNTSNSLNTSPAKNINISNTIGSSGSSTNSNPLLNNVTTHQMASLLPPESPKKGIFDYATIDFNKTVALSNSTTPPLDCEGSRKTRHSSTIAPNITSTTGTINVAAPPSHSNSISD